MTNTIDKPSSGKSAEELIKEILAEQIGVEPEDIEKEDSLSEHLHMSAADLAHLVNALQERGIDISQIELAELETVDDLIEFLSSKELID